MSPRGSSSSQTRSSAAPYARRANSQPKSSRQQFSACGACRMRRVRCDLKDLPIGFVGPHPACSNCKERGIKCVDEFADVKAVKLLRRGRRLQQVEAIYGKVSDQDGSSSALPSGSKSTVNIPNLLPEFFVSPFWRWFSIQRPILDHHEFPARFNNHCKGTQLLANEGGLLAMLLVTWAASFGLNERGLPDPESPSDSDPLTPGGASPHYPQSTKYPPAGNRRIHWKNKSEEYLREILELIDYYGILRRPSLDGLRCLLLVLPLMEEGQPLERLAIHEAALSQTHALCVLSASNTASYEDAATRARLFWYAYTQEGVTTGIRGGRLVLNNEELEAFQRTLPPPNFGMDRSITPPSPSSLDPSPGMAQYHIPALGDFTPQESASHKALMHLMHLSSTPLELNNVCRRIHDVLTGIKATRRAEDHGLIDAHSMREIWRGLDHAWQDLENKKRAPIEPDSILQRLELTQYVGAWQIFIFECHNVIRETLKNFIATPTAQAYVASPPRPPSSHSASSSPYLPPQQLHATAVRKCQTMLPIIIRILRLHTPVEHSDVPGIFRWDSGLVRDGCFFAGYLAANTDSEYIDAPSDDNKQDACLSVDDGVSICLTALTTMRWGSSKSEEREDTIRMVWKNRKHGRQGQAHHLPLYDVNYPSHLGMSGGGEAQVHMGLSSSPHAGVALSISGERPMLPPLNVFAAQRRVDSGPSTAASSDDRGLSGWPGYTPPGTGTSIATSTGTGLSRRGSPVFPGQPSYKQGAGDDIFYHGAGDVDQFSYSVPLSGPGAIVRGEAPASAIGGYAQRGGAIEQTHGSIAGGGAQSYMPAGTFAPHPTIVTSTNYYSCPQFGENCHCNGEYH